jgi:hypothetical protein
MANTYTLIASSTVGSGGAAEIDFTAIPATYTDLCLKLSIRTDKATLGDVWLLKLNTSSADFTARWIEGNGASASSGSSILYGALVGSSATASTFNNTEIYFPNYAGSTNKSFSVDSVTENNATTAYIDLAAGLWSQTAAITGINISITSNNLVQYSTAYLYGIKNS